MMLLYQTVVAVKMLSDWNQNDKPQCAGISHGEFKWVLQLIWYDTVVMFVALRVYAIHPGPNWKAFILVLGVGMFESIVNIFYDTGVSLRTLNLSPTAYTQSVCIATQSTDNPSTLSDGVLVLRLNRVFFNFAYVAAILLTWVRIPNLKSKASEGGSNSSTWRMLLQDGSVFFLPLFVLHAIWVVGNSSFLIFGLPVCPLVEALSSILISRFILSLRSVYQIGSDEETIRTQKPRLWATKYGAILIGNLGARLEDIDNNDEEKMDMTYSMDPFAMLSERPAFRSVEDSRVSLHTHSVAIGPRKHD